MEAERWKQIERLYHSALKRVPEERASYIMESCGADTALRSEVESLLAAHHSQDSLLDKPAFSFGMKLISESQVELTEGQQFGSYEILKPVGKGGMGIVYQARDARLGRRIAIKLLPASLMQDHERVLRFRQEARAASHISHPNIAHIYEIGETEGRHYIALEFVEGLTLRERLLQGHMEIAEAVNVCVQVALALHAAHEAGIVHRDIKPENIMLRTDGYVKVLDFGLAKLSEQTQTQPDADLMPVGSVTTEPGLIIGTAHYMSPEQARGFAVDARTDIWSLGVVLYEMLTGRVPFEGATNVDVIAEILKSEPPPLARLLPGVPRQIESIVMKALQKSLSARYRTCAEMSADLRLSLRELDANPAQIPPAQLTTVTEKIEVSTAESLTTSDNRTETAETKNRSASSARRPSPRFKSFHNIFRIQNWKTLLILVAVAGAAFALWRSQFRGVSPGAREANLVINKLTDNGRMMDAVISPDGNYLAYVELDEGRQALRLKRMKTGETLELVAPAEVEFWGITFSHTGASLYYNVKRKNSTIGEVSVIPSLGGAAEQVSTNVDSPVTLSPDDKQMAFVRRYPMEKRDVLVTANADGSAERELLVRKHPETFSFGGPSWSPDGKFIAVSAGSVVNNAYTVIGVQVSTGEARRLTSQEWHNVGPVAYMPDGQSLIASVINSRIGAYQICRILLADGSVKQMTNDVDDYPRIGGLSLTGDASALVTIQSDKRSNIWLTDLAKNLYKKITAGKYEGYYGLAWLSDNKVVYVSAVADHQNLWTMNPDGKQPQQLVAVEGVLPVVSPDGRFIFYVSTQSGTYNIWRADADGQNQKQLTNGGGESWISCSPNGQWLAYTSLSNERFTIWKVSADGGAPVQLTTKPSIKPVISPDGKWIACSYREEQSSPWKVAVISSEGGEPVKMFDMPSAYSQVVRWTRDGLNLAYLVSQDGVSNIWLQPLNGDSPSQLTNFDEDTIYYYDISPDGKYLIVARGSTSRDIVTIDHPGL